MSDETNILLKQLEQQYNKQVCGLKRDLDFRLEELESTYDNIVSELKLVDNTNLSVFELMHNDKVQYRIAGNHKNVYTERYLKLSCDGHTFFVNNLPVFKPNKTYDILLFVIEKDDKNDK